MTGYTARDVSKIIDLSVDQIRGYARAGFLSPRRGPRGEYRFTFQDLVLLRTARGLSASRVTPRKIKSALRRLRERLPSGRPLTAVQITVEGEEIVVRDGRATWSPESGQTYLDFEVRELAEKVAPLARAAAEEAFGAEEMLTAEEWCELGCQLETADPVQARDAYRRALEMDPGHPESHVNLGGLLHEIGHAVEAVAHYRLALSRRPEYAIGMFHLGVALETLEREADALEAYRGAVTADPTCAEAHFNLSRIHEKQGRTVAALRHLDAYRKLVRR